MLHKGQRIPGADYFDDHGESGSDTGIFEHSGGAEAYEGEKRKRTREGIEIEFSCKTCGARKNLVLDWRELTIVGSNMPGMPGPLILPEGWAQSQTTGVPGNVVVCSTCRKLANVFPVTPDAARAEITKAIDGGLLPLGQMKQWQAEALRARGVVR